MAHVCTLCSAEAKFPVRFVSNEGIPMGESHLAGACCYLAQQLLASKGVDPEILDQTRTAIIKLEQAPIEGRCFNYFDSDIETCKYINGVQVADVQSFALKIFHSFIQSAVGENSKSIGKKVWIELRDEYQREIEVTNECWVKQLYNYWENMGTGGRTAFMAFGSLAVWGVQGIWEAAFYPQGKPKEDEKKPPCSLPVDIHHHESQVTHF